MKLNRLLGKYQSLGRSRAQAAVAAGRVRVNGRVVSDAALEIRRFDKVELETELVQPGARALYLMLHKPAGYLSATVDAAHPTVLDLIDDPDKAELHLAGRLDRYSTGLLLLTNDGVWSKRITEPVFKLPKVYRVTTQEPIAGGAEAAFTAGFYFHTEDLTTQPAELVRLAERVARVTLWEGRYHQIKRMFHRIGNRVASLHREAIGPLHLPADLASGQWRHLTAEEVDQVQSPQQAAARSGTYG
jgi:16S rRNA pseudouridine516 synthase